MHTINLCLEIQLGVQYNSTIQFTHTALRLTTANLVSVLKGIENRWNDLGDELKYPQSLLEEIEKQYLSTRERLTAVVKHFLQLHPFASWRRIIRGLERLEEHSIVKQIKTQAERVLGKRTLSNEFSDLKVPILGIAII